MKTRVSIQVNGRGTVKATEFFVEMMQGAVQPNEILVGIRVPFTVRSVALAADQADEGVEPLNDIHASADFRAQLTRVHAQRALELAASRA